MRDLLTEYTEATTLYEQCRSEAERLLRDGKIESDEYRDARRRGKEALTLAESLQETMNDNARYARLNPPVIDDTPRPPAGPISYAAPAPTEWDRPTHAPTTWERLSYTSENDPTRGNEYTEGFVAYLQSRGRHVPHVLYESHNEIYNRRNYGLYIGSDPDGGYLLPAEWREQILRRLPAQSEIISLATPVSAGGDRVEWPRIEPNPNAALTDIYTSAFVGSMVGETTGGGVAAPKFGKFGINLGKARVATRASMDLLQDVPSLYSTLLQDGATNLALLAESQVLSGNGAGNNLVGMLTMPSAPNDSREHDEIGTIDVAGTTANTISNTTSNAGSVPKLLDLLYAVPGQYRRQHSFRFVFASQTEKAIRKLVDASGSMMWSPGRISGDLPDTLLGKPTVPSEFAPLVGTAGNKVIIAGDWSQLYFVTNGDIRLQIADQLYAETDEIGFFLRWRFGVGLANPAAFKFGIV